MKEQVSSEGGTQVQHHKAPGLRGHLHLGAPPGHLGSEPLACHGKLEEQLNGEKERSATALRRGTKRNTQVSGTDWKA